MPYLLHFPRLRSFITRFCHRNLQTCSASFSGTKQLFPITVLLLGYMPKPLLRALTINFGRPAQSYISQIKIREAPRTAKDSFKIIKRRNIVVVSRWRASWQKNPGYKTHQQTNHLHSDQKLHPDQSFAQAPIFAPRPQFAPKPPFFCTKT